MLDDARLHTAALRRLFRARVFGRRTAEDESDAELTARERSRLQSHFVKTVLVMLFLGAPRLYDGLTVRSHRQVVD